MTSQSQKVNQRAVFTGRHKIIFEKKYFFFLLSLGFRDPLPVEGLHGRWKPDVLRPATVGMRGCTAMHEMSSPPYRRPSGLDGRL